MENAAMWKPGDTLRLYELLAPIPGTLGKLWRARHTLNQSPVILKRLDDRERVALQRLFERRLASPRLIAFLDLGDDFAVMDDGGETLQARLDAGGIAPENRAPIVREFFRALADLHAAAIVHGDLKPLNVLVAENDRRDIDGDWRVRLIDFGLATEIPADDFAHTLAVTREQLGGTPLYLDPAVATARGADLDARRRDPRTDLYAAGIVAHQVLFGAPPSYGQPLPAWLGRCLGAWDERFEDATAALRDLERRDAAAEEAETGVFPAVVPRPHTDEEDEDEDEEEEAEEEDGEAADTDRHAPWILTERVEQAVRDAGDAERLGLDWVSGLSPETAEKLVGWGRGESGDRRLVLSSLGTLGAATAAKLVGWGRGESGDRRLDLNGLTALGAATAAKLAGWGHGDSGERKLSLNGLTALDAATAKALAAWGRRDSGWRGLYLDGLTALDADTARALAGWGHGDSGERKLCLNGLTALDADAARALRELNDRVNRWLISPALAALPADLASTDADEEEAAGEEEGEEEEEAEGEAEGEAEEEEQGQENQDAPSHAVAARDLTPPLASPPLSRAVRERVALAIHNAERASTLGLDWLDRLDAATAERLARWGERDCPWWRLSSACDAKRTLTLRGLTTLDAATAEKLAEWGLGKAEERSLYLSGLRTLESATAAKLAEWGLGDPGPRGLRLGVTALAPETAKKLAAWGRGDSGLRVLYLERLRTLDDRGVRSLQEFANRGNCHLVLPKAGRTTERVSYGFVTMILLAGAAASVAVAFGASGGAGLVSATAAVILYMGWRARS